MVAGFIKRASSRRPDSNRDDLSITGSQPAAYAIPPRRGGAVERNRTFTLRMERRVLSALRLPSFATTASSRRPGDRTQRGGSVKAVCSPAHSPPGAGTWSRTTPRRLSGDVGPPDRYLRCTGPGDRTLLTPACKTEALTRRRARRGLRGWSRTSLILLPKQADGRCPTRRWFPVVDSNHARTASRAGMLPLHHRGSVPTERVERSSRAV